MGILEELKALWGDDFEQQARQTVEYGMGNCAWPGFIYYTETIAFYAVHQEEIWGLVRDAAEAEGMTPLALITGLNGADIVDGHDTFANLLVWFAVERVCEIELNM